MTPDIRFSGRISSNLSDIERLPDIRPEPDIRHWKSAGYLVSGPILRKKYCFSVTEFEAAAANDQEPRERLYFQGGGAHAYKTLGTMVIKLWVPV